MASLLIRNLDDETKTRLRVRAAEKGRSMEAEARDILSRELSERYPREPKPQKNLAEIAREIFGPLGGVDLEPHPRVAVREPPDFGE
jgi:plasmid stability protein